MRLTLRGQMVPLPHQDAFLLLAQPAYVSYVDYSIITFNFIIIILLLLLLLLLIFNSQRHPILRRGAAVTKVNRNAIIIFNLRFFFYNL